MTAGRTNPWLVLVLVCLAQFMVVLDATIVNVALPSIQTDLDMSEASLQWIVNAYTLLFGGFLLLGGRADAVGERQRLGEILEREAALEPSDAIDLLDLPVRDLRLELRDLGVGDGRFAPAAGRA